MKADLQDLFITSAKEVEVSNTRKAIIIHVPFRLLKGFHRYDGQVSSLSISSCNLTFSIYRCRIQQRLIRELEKKFAGKHVTIVAQRRILPREGRKNRTSKQMRPFSRTLTSVRPSMLAHLLPPSLPSFP